jgi:superfamily II RNA helicase
VSNCNNSLFNHQDSKSFVQLEKQYWELKQQVEQMESFNEKIKDETEIYKKVIDIEKKLKPESSMFIRLAAKLEKKLINEKNELLKKLDVTTINTLKQYFSLKTQLDNLEESLVMNKSKINEQVSLIVDFLISSSYVNQELKLTKFGKIIAETNECNPFLLGELVQSKYFDSLEFPEIIGILSMFISENKKADEIYVDDLVCGENCKEIIYQLEKYIEKYYVIETELNNKLPYPTWLEWDLDLSLFNSAKDWADGKTWSSISVGFNSFQGNFIKSILRITNLLKNIESIAKIFSNVELLNKLEGYQEKLIRDIVITDSLYLLNC